MQERTRLEIAATIGALCFLVCACDSQNGIGSESNATPDGAVSAGGAGATGTLSPGSGGTTGQPGNSSSQGTSQPAPNQEPDAGRLSDAAARLDGAQAHDSNLDRDVGKTSDAGSLPDATTDAATRLDVAQARDSDADRDSGTAPDAEIVLHGLTPGLNCFKITSIAPGYHDGCQMGIETLVGLSLQGDYDPSTGTFKLGALGSLGSGPIRYNLGTLQRPRGSAGDPNLPGCTWYQADTTLLTMTDTNKFTVSVTEIQDTIARACGTPFASCTSNWNWTMEIDSARTAPTCN